MDVTIGGGVVRYCELAWIECPEIEGAVGEVIRAGRVEVLRDGRVSESFDAVRGDVLLAADGQAVAPGARLKATLHARGVRAWLPPGGEAVVRWSEEASVTVSDEVTGLSRLRWPAERDVHVDLYDDRGALVARLGVPWAANPLVASGERVRRGQLLAWAPLEGVNRDPALHGIDGLIAFLGGRVPNRYPVAAIAPCDGVVEATAPHFVLRARDGRAVRVRRRARSVALVHRGDSVRAGGRLEEGWRSHHRLLRACGERWLGEHLVAELHAEFASRRLAVPPAYLSLLVRAMLAWKRVRRPGDTGLRRNQVLARDAFDRIQEETVQRGGRPAEAVTVLRGLRSLAPYPLSQPARAR